MTKLERRQVRRRGSLHEGLWFCAAAATGAAAAATHAEVLHDTTAMTDNGAYDGLAENFLGGFAEHNVLLDQQSADDFDLLDRSSITSVTFDLLTHSPFAQAAPADGVLIEFWPDDGGAPTDGAIAAYFSTDFELTQFTDTVFGITGLRFSVDLTRAGITLGPGTWWASLVPVDETPSGINYKSIRTEGFPIGHSGHVRDGGVAHGNGYQGLYGTPNWEPFSFYGLNPSDIAMKIEGEPTTPPCQWDCDGNADGIVSVTDLLALLGQFDPSSPINCNGGACDFDTNGCVDVVDLLSLLAHYDPAGLRCP